MAPALDPPAFEPTAAVALLSAALGEVSRTP
eukprot:CAMPEP_0168824774 /NCGR_PEP_ID=MMETSP0726-20121227/11279_1 /TAXON_ID=265536 /ORGANISM="Amphiprora sp., Strain CCMP467" /LENGTH=30 /DNA_ID= /DNA_START= /DNA_END= /DNA_ORIENTATION=